MKKAAYVTGCILYCCVAFAQFDDTTHHHISYGATGTINRANEGHSYVLNNALTFEISKKNISLNTSNNWVYGESQGQITNNDFSSALNFDLYKATRTWYYWGLASYTTSYSLNIGNQFQTGFGIGHNTIRKKNAELVISDGILFETSNLHIPEPDKDTYVTARHSLRIKYRWVIWNIVVLDGMHFWQPAFNSLSNYIIKSSNNLSVVLNKWLSLTTSLNYNRFNQTSRENMLINFGLTLERYF